VAQVIVTPVRVATGGGPVTVSAKGVAEVKLGDPPAAVALTVRFVEPAATPETNPELEIVAAEVLELSQVPQVVP
jgi:hypothetical protein